MYLLIMLIPFVVSPYKYKSRDYFIYNQYFKFYNYLAKFIFNMLTLKRNIKEILKQYENIKRTNHLINHILNKLVVCIFITI